MTPLAIAKERLTISELWTMRDWRGRPGRSCRVPYRQDRTPSGSVLADGQLFHDFTTGENLDAPGLLARVEELTNEAACRLFLSLAGVKPCDAHEFSSVVPSRAAVRDEPRERPKLPELRPPSPVELRHIADPSLCERRGM
jgi:hypothetical protein